MNARRIRSAAEIGLTIALAAVLHLIAVWQMPQGGSYSLAMLPLFVLALMRGVGPGMTAGALYGLLDLAMKPYIYHPVQVVLDYPLAYALVGLAGLLSVRWRRLHAADRPTAGVWTAVVPGIIVGALGRYAAHVASGVIFFSSYALELGEAPLWYSLVYNSFVLLSAVACAFAVVAVLPPLQSAFGVRER
jgi:thiamine transporter